MSSTGIYFWNYQYLYGKADTLACWVAGLYCGQQPIDPSGYVFVPWQSDPDKKFTADYLINVSNNPPVGGFGASACNIDITNQDGSLGRVIVDVAIGVSYTSKVQLLRPNVPDQTNSQYGPSLGETRRLHQYGVLLAQSRGISIGTTPDNVRPMEFTDPDGADLPNSELFSGVHWGFLDCDYDYDGMMYLEMIAPYPATIASLAGFIKTFARD
jgi:hypothetical protein